MPEHLPHRDMTPNEQLLFEIETDEITAAASGPVVLSPEEDAKAREAVLELLRSLNLPLPPEQDLRTPGSISLTSRTLKVDPIPTIAAADAVKATVDWEAGQVRLLQSSMGSDLAVEVTVDEDRRSEFEGFVFFVELTESAPPVAVFAGHSPVFTGVEPEALTHGASLTLRWAQLADIGRESLPALRRSLRNLRDPSSLEWYEGIIGQIEDA